MSRRAIIATLTVIALLVVGGAGSFLAFRRSGSFLDSVTSNATSRPAPVVTPQEASEVMRRYTTRTMLPLVARDSAAEQRIESGVAADIDDADFRIARDTDRTMTVFQAREVSLFVRRQLTFPAQFVVRFRKQVDGKPLQAWTTFYLFVKSSAAASWLLNDFASVPAGTAVPTGRVDRDGYLAGATDIPMAGIPLARDVRDAWVAVESDGAVGLPLSDEWTVTAGLTKPVTPPRIDGGWRSVGYTTSPFAPTCVPLRQMVCFVSSRYLSFTYAFPTGYIVETKEGQGSVLGLTPGHYASITARMGTEALIALAPGGKLTLLGWDAYPLSASGEPASSDGPAA